MGKRIYTFALTDEEKSALERVISSPDSSARAVMRARILLLSADQMHGKKTLEAIAEELGSTKATVATVRAGYAEHGINIVNRKPRTIQKPKKRKITDEAITQILLVAQEEPPEGKKKWSLELLCKECVERGIVSSIGKSRMAEILKQNK